MIGEATLEMTTQAMEQINNRFAADDKLYVRFFMHPKQNPAKTKAEGRPIFEDKEYIQIMTPGNKTDVIMRPVSAEDKERFAKAYQRFKASEEEVLEGTLLEHWPVVTRAQVEEMKYFNIRTVEQLAGMPDSNAQNFMGVLNLKRQAQDWLAQADANFVSDLKEQLAERDRQLAAMAERLDALEAEEPEED